METLGESQLDFWVFIGKFQQKKDLETKMLLF